MKIPSRRWRNVTLALLFGFVWIDGSLRHFAVEPSWLWSLVVIGAFLIFLGISELLTAIYIKHGPDL